MPGTTKQALESKPDPSKQAWISKQAHQNRRACFDRRRPVLSYHNWHNRRWHNLRTAEQARLF